jgi:hypothetical protein
LGQGKLALRGRLTPEAVLLAALGLWSLLPFAVLLGHGGVFNGSTGPNVADHMQYMSFIRESGEHVLISNRFDVVPDRHLFFHPVDFVSGVAWRLGASIQVAFLLWLPLSIAALFVGFAAYVRRFLAPHRIAIGVALLLAFFYVTPAMPLADWLGGSPKLRFGTLIVGLEMFPGSYPWGGFPGAIAVALMPIFLLAIERVLEPSRRAATRSARWYAVWAGVAGGLVMWLHPWQGMTLLAIVGGLVLWGRLHRRYLALALPVLLTAAPLAYFWALSHTHSSWQAVSHPNGYPHLGSWLVLGLAPLVLALPGFRGRNLDEQERMIRIWPFAALAVYFYLDKTWFYHAFGGLSLPLAVLAVKGWRDVHIPRVAVAIAVLVVTVPGLAFTVHELHKSRPQHFFTPGERRALAFLDHAPRSGAVLAPAMPLGQAVPAFAGRATYVGHYYWTPGFEHRRSVTEALFDGRLPRAQAVALVRDSRAAFLVSDCGRKRVDLQPQLGPLFARVRHFGCATVYELRTSSLQAQITPASPPRSGSPA